MAPRALLLGALALVTLLSAAVPASADDVPATSPTLQAGETWSHAFNKVGEYPYICTFHPAMKGTIIVKEDAAVGGETNVTMRDNTFEPATLEVQPGTVVVFTNEGRQPHNAKLVDTSDTPLPALVAVAAVGIAAVLLVRRRA